MTQIVPVELSFIPNEDFLCPKNRAKFCREMAGFGELSALAQSIGNNIEQMCSMPLLAREQEQHLFRQMNCLKYRANLAFADYRKSSEQTTARAKKLADWRRLTADIKAIQDVVVLCNVRLMVSIIKKHRAVGDRFMERFSDGVQTLIRCVERFDYSRGWKFSTYISVSAWKNFSQSISAEWTHESRYRTVGDFPQRTFEEDFDGRMDQKAAQKRVQLALSELDKVNPRMADILRRRFGVDSARQTLEAVGMDLGITKERVRQVQRQASGRIKAILETIK